MRKLLPALLAVIVVTGGPLGAAELGAARIILLANSDDPDSLRVAVHYAEARGVPKANIIAQKMPLVETISWPEFVTAVWQPLQDELVRRQWIDATPKTLTDAVGRKEYAISGHRISYLVVCRGVPLRIAHSAALYVPPQPPLDRPEFRTNEAAVDSELSLLAQTNSAINAFVPNPLFQNDRPAPWDRVQVVKVTRLDGPTVDDALALVDHALAAERTGLLGRAYIDLDINRAEGDRWLLQAAAQLSGLDFDVDVERTPATFPLTARFDAPVLYFGWYTGSITGPFLLPGFRFPPGAVAVHIYSYSADTLRSANSGWCGPFVARGVTATVGNVFEPYLQLLHRPDLLLRALVRGDTFGDAAYYAEPVLSWQAIAIGDPLYRPFAVSPAEQWRSRSQLPDRLAGYATLREMHRLETRHRPDEARRVGEAAQLEQPSLALGFALAQRREQAGDLAGAGRAMAIASRLSSFQSDDWVLAGESARLLKRAGCLAEATQVYRHLLQEPALPSELRVTWLSEASAAALTSGDAVQASAWQKEFDELAPGQKK